MLFKDYDSALMLAAKGEEGHPLLGTLVSIYTSSIYTCVCVLGTLVCVYDIET